MKQEQIGFNSGKVQLSGNLIIPESEQKLLPAVMFVHGWTSSQSKYIPRGKTVAKNVGCMVLTFDLRGHGKSGGELKDFSRLDHANDITKAHEFLKNHQLVDNNRIGLIGKSYGGYLVAYLASTLSPKTVILSAPALYPDKNFDQPTNQIIENDPDIIRQTNQTLHGNKALSSLHDYPGDVLIIEMENDEEIPQSTTSNYIKIIKNIKHKQIKGSDHTMSNPRWDQEFVNIVSHWMVQHL